MCSRVVFVSMATLWETVSTYVIVMSTLQFDMPAACSYCSFQHHLKRRAVFDADVGVVPGPSPTFVGRFKGHIKAKQETACIRLIKMY